jgi:hypothetical protein
MYCTRNTGWDRRLVARATGSVIEAAVAGMFAVGSSMCSAGLEVAGRRAHGVVWHSSVVAEEVVGSGCSAIELAAAGAEGVYILQQRAECRTHGAAPATALRQV